MKIISKKHDYYDVVMKQACDRSIIFNREHKENVFYPWGKTMGKVDVFSDSRFGSVIYSKISRNKVYSEITPILVFFCGRIIPLARIMVNDTTHNACGDVSYTFAYSMGDVPKKVSKLALSCVELWLSEAVFNRNLATINYNKKYDSKPQFAANQNELAKYAINNNIAYFSISIKEDYTYENAITHYPILKDIEFYRIVSPFDAFQQIQTYLTNDLAKEKKMPIKPISDDLKAQSHGFDKYSFRKDKSK